jgi:hypothetical protein
VVRMTVAHHQSVCVPGLMAQGLQVVEQGQGGVGGVHQDLRRPAVLVQGQPESQAVGRHQGLGEASHHGPLHQAGLGGLKHVKEIVHQDFHGDGVESRNLHVVLLKGKTIRHWAFFIIHGSITTLPVTPAAVKQFGRGGTGESERAEFNLERSPSTSPSCCQGTTKTSQIKVGCYMHLFGP